MSNSVVLALFFGLVLGTHSSAWGARTNEVSWAFESYFFGEQVDLAESTPNPGNAVFGSAQTVLTLDNRLNLKWLINDAKIILRPRWTIAQTRAKNETTQETKTRTQGELDLTDAFYEQTWNRRFSSTVGLQVYQWGPGEIFNPSNPFFRFNNQQTAFAFKEKGKVLARFNYSIGMEHSLVLIGEPVSNNEPHWMSERKFKPQAALKFERNWKNTRNYYGLVGGMEGEQNPFAGEYAHYEFTEGLSAYFDAKHSHQLLYYGPALNALGSYDMVLRGEEAKVWSHLALVGFRYEGNVDFRIEYLHNSLGYKKEDFDNAILSASTFFNPNYVQNINRFALSGLNLLSQNYLYASLRIMDPWKWRDFNFYLRTLNSMLDKSGLVQTEFDKSVGDSFTAFGNYTVFSGAKNTEFRLFNDWRILLGIKYAL
jgi:hypothetical protein